MQSDALMSLIQEARRRHQDHYGRPLSYADIARRAGLPKSTVYKLATEPSASPPRPTTLEKLAKGIAMPLRVVMEAASIGSGYHRETIEVDEQTQVIVANLESLTEAQRAQVAALVAAMTEQRGPKPNGSKAGRRARR